MLSVNLVAQVLSILGLVAGVTGFILQRNPRANLLRCWYTCTGGSMTLYIGQEPLIFVNWDHARIEVPTMRPPGKAYYVLPGEGCHLLKFGGKLLVIEMCNVCKDGEQYIISGPKGLPHRYVKHCQQEGERSQGVTHYTPASRPKREKGHEPWLAFDKKPARTFDSVAFSRRSFLDGR